MYRFYGIGKKGVSVMNNTTSTFLRGFLTVIVAAGLIFTMACGGGGGSSSSEKDPIANIRLVQLDQYRKLHKNVSNGGQYLIATLAIENITKTDQKFRPNEFVIRKSPTEENPDPFEQNVEQNINVHYQLQFGQESLVRLFDKEVTVHPGFTVKKELVYQIPENADFNEYEIRYIPFDEAYPLNGTEVDIRDHRDEEDESAKPLPHAY